jgi:hypothetical protein
MRQQGVHFEQNDFEKNIINLISCEIRLFDILITLMKRKIAKDLNKQISLVTQ